MRSRFELTAAFEATDYCVDYQKQIFILHPGCPPLDAISSWVAAHNGAAPAWLITACNPGGEAISEIKNRALVETLDAQLNRAGLHCLTAVNRDPTGNWPDEPSRLIAGLEEGMARTLARRFGQAAIVAVRHNSVELAWETN